MTDTVRWKKLTTGKYRAAGVGTVWHRPTGWYFYRPGERKSSGGAFSSKVAVTAHALGVKAG